MADYKVTDAELTSIANAIRTKGGTQAQLEFPTGFVSAVQAIPTGGGSTNILSGMSDPTPATGENGAIYLRYSTSSYLEIGESNSAYFDTGFSLTPNSEYEIDFQYTMVPQYNSGLFGAYASSKQTTVVYANNVIYLQAGGSNVYIPFDTSRHIFKATHSAFIIDSIMQSGIPNWANTAQKNAWILKANNDASYTNYCKLYGCKIWDNDVLVRDFVPYVRVSDSEVGLYDRVHDVFYAKNGSGIITYEQGGLIATASLKVNGAWQNLIGSNINDVNLGGN